MNGQSSQNVFQALGLQGLIAQSGQSQWAAHGNELGLQNALNPYAGTSGFHNVAPSTFVGSDGDYWETRDQRRLKRAQDLAAEARSRHPEMQVKRRTRTEDICK